MPRGSFDRAKRACAARRIQEAARAAAAEETLAGILIMLLVLIPYCAISVLNKVLGEGRLARMFFVDRGLAAG